MKNKPVWKTFAKCLRNIPLLKITDLVIRSNREAIGAKLEMVVEQPLQATMQWRSADETRASKSFGDFMVAIPLRSLEVVIEHVLSSKGGAGGTYPLLRFFSDQWVRWLEDHKSARYYLIRRISRRTSCSHLVFKNPHEKVQACLNHSTLKPQEPHRWLGGNQGGGASAKQTTFLTSRKCSVWKSVALPKAGYKVLFEVRNANMSNDLDPIDAADKLLDEVRIDTTNAP